MGGIRAPVVVLLAVLGCGSSGWSATSGERDQHAKAIAALIAADMRLPSERQFAEFQAAGYPADDVALGLVLRFLYLERFTAPGASDAEQKRLREQVSRLQQNMSATARVVLARGTGTSVDLVNAIARVVHPDDAPPLVPIAAEKSAYLREQVSRLIAVVEDEFHQALAVVRTHEASEQELTEDGPHQRAAIQAAVERRMAALRPLRTGMLVLRKVAIRGNDYGVDPKPVREHLCALFLAKPPMASSTNLSQLLADWDFAWGDICPVLGEWCGALLADALILGLSEVHPEEVDRIQRRALALDPRQQREARVQIEVHGMQVRTVTDAMRWRLQRGDRAGFAEAWQLWQEFGQRAQQDPRLVPGRTPHLGTDIARLHLIAARTAAAMGNRAEAGMVLQRFLARGPTPPFDVFAKHWRAFLVGGVAPEPVIAQAMDPEQAIVLARAHLDEAKATGDAQAARRQHLEAAAVLRRGILGLSAQRDERAAAEHLAQLYHLYVMTLHRLEMRHHAAIAALAGTDQALRLIERLGQQKQPNPWKRATADGRSAWDESRVTPMRLATDGMIIANQLKHRDPGMNGLYLATLERLKRLDQPGGTPDLRRQQILAMLEEQDYEGALREAEHLLRERPELDVWVGALRNTATSAWAQRLRRERETVRADALLAKLARENVLLLEKIRSELARSDLLSARRHELEGGIRQIGLAEIETLLVRQDYDPALARLADLLDDLSPGDAAQVVRVQERLAQAAGQWLEAQRPTIATPLPTLRDLADRLERIRTTLQTSSTTSGTPLPVTVSQRLALAYHRLRGVLPAQVPSGSDDALVQLVRALDRGFAESFAPTIDAQTPAGNLMALGNAWWDLAEQAKAIAPYEQYITRIQSEQAVAEFLMDRGAWLAPRTEVLSSRAEFRTRWNHIIVSCIGDGDRVPPDLRAAATTVSALKDDIDATKAVLGAELHLRLITAVGEVDAVIRKLRGVALARERLAGCYRATGRPDAAVPHLKHLCAQEPDDLGHRLALVLAIQDSQKPSSRADLEQARTLAAQIRDARHGTTDKVGYWEAALLVLEFSLLLGDQRLVDDTLAYMGRNRSDLSRDLVAPSAAGDDRRVRRPSGSDAVTLAPRFLDLYGKPGITARPPFRVERVSGGIDLFVDSGAPAPVARVMTTKDDQQVVVYVMEEDGTMSPQAVP